MKFRFSLRTLLWLVTLVCCTYGAYLRGHHDAMEDRCGTVTWWDEDHHRTVVKVVRPVGTPVTFSLPPTAYAMETTRNVGHKTWALGTQYGPWNESSFWQGLDDGMTRSVVPTPEIPDIPVRGPRR